MRKLKIGDKVKLTPRYINWWIFSNANYKCSKCSEERYHAEIMIGLISLMMPIYGTIVGINVDYIQVEFNVDGIRDKQWYTKRSLK